MRISFSRPSGLEPLESEAGDFARIFEIELVLDVRAVCLHCLWTEMQQSCDLTHFVAFPDKLKNFKFAIAQSFDRVHFAFGAAMGEFGNNLRRHGRAEIRTTIKNFVDC